MKYNINNITIIGAGTMGHSIGQEFAMSNFQVSFFDKSEKILAGLKSRIENNLKEMAEWGLISKDNIQSALDCIEVHHNIEEAVSNADLVIEAVFEDLDLKKQVFSELDQVCPEKTILASNTSSLMPSSLAEATARPDRVLVLHYFYPPHLMPLVEIVKSEKTNQEAADAVYKAVMQAGKKPIITNKEALGFVANRLQSALLREAIYIIEQGICSAEEIDIAVKYGFGRRLAHVGPIELAEVQDGWFIMSQIQKYIFPDLNNDSEPSKIVQEKINNDELGPQTGKGFYQWPEGSVNVFEKHLYSQLAKYIREEKNKNNNDRRNFRK